MTTKNRRIEDERLSVVTAPTLLPVTIAEIRRQVVVDTSDYDPQLEAFAEMATSQYENDTQMNLMEKTYIWTLPFFYDERIYLPKRPVTAIDWIKYYDGNETLATITSTDYELVSGIDGFNPGIPYFELKWDKDWPSTHSSRIDSVQIQFKAGFGSTQASIPNLHKYPIWLAAAYMFEHRGEPISQSLKHLEAYQNMVNRFLPVRVP